MRATNISENKFNGRYYTPSHIVALTLDLVGYNGPVILKKHLIDNSSGDGAFLFGAVKRYIDVALSNDYDRITIKQELETYIHGIEINETERNKSIKRLSELTKNIGNVDWDIVCGDALLEQQYNKKMDYVVGNPPFVRIHNYGDRDSVIKSLPFCKNGMTDLYIAFYSIGLSMMADTGILSYITPSSLFNSQAGKELRNYLITNNLLKSVVNFKHQQLFNANTYVSIITLQNNNQNTQIDYYVYKNNIQKVCSINKNSININDIWYFGTENELQQLRQIKEETDNRIKVKNGLCTLCDRFYISSNRRFKQYEIPIIKASTGKQYWCLFPYTDDGKLLGFEQLKEQQDYYLEHKNILTNRSIRDKNKWWGFGREQGIKDTFKRKYSVSSIIKNKDDLKIIECNEKVGIYSGLYVIGNITLTELKRILLTDEFINYVKLLSKYKQGGYYTFNAKDLEQYINHTLLTL